MHSIEYSLLLFIEQVDIFIHFSSFSISSIIFFLYSLIEKGVTKIPFLSSSIISEQLEKLFQTLQMLKPYKKSLLYHNIHQAFEILQMNS